MEQKRKFHRIKIMIIVGVIGLLLYGIGSNTGHIKKLFAVQKADFHISAESVQYNARTGRTYFEVRKGTTWSKILVKGVNMGMGTPGHFPGEAAITKAQYVRWLRQIGKMNANAIRLYTLHPPAFYEALYEYNQTTKKPIYLFQGVWVDEEAMYASNDVFSTKVADTFNEECLQLVDVIHGKSTVAAEPGHASGTYKWDVSPYVLGWMIGIEWDPTVVQATNSKHSALADYRGQYVQTSGAQPFEIWLARQLDRIATYEMKQYKWQTPLSFTNWITTDLLKHPSEPESTEDMVTVNPNVIKATAAFPAGLFASYHAYPYYPDFMNYDANYAKTVNVQGKQDAYAGYLRELIAAHSGPVLIAEFGVPSSRGMTHLNVNGANQGFLSEKKQGEINTTLFSDIVHEGAAGGIVFTWQDEWFKRVWNTMAYDNADRRPFWSNAQTSEQQYGLLAFDPGKKATIQVDGATKDWHGAQISASLQRKNNTPLLRAYHDGYDQQRSIQAVYATSDERYMYWRIDLGNDAQTLDWSKVNVALAIDTLKDQGQTKLPNVSSLRTEAGSEFVIVLGGQQQSRILVDSYYDTFQYHYAVANKYIPLPSQANKRDNGVYNPMRLILSKEMMIPDRVGANRVIPLKSYETGVLHFGNANPASSKFDSLTDVSVNNKTHSIEIRIPWALLNVKDPSTMEAMGNIWQGGLNATAKLTGIRYAVVSYNPNTNEAADALPQPVQGVIPSKNSAIYQWKTWQQPQYHERLKSSYYTLQETFAKAKIQTK